MTTWHLIGNGEGTATRQTGEKIVRFNQQTTSPAWDLNICNGRSVGAHRTFVLSGTEPVSGFAGLLEENAPKLNHELGAWPSSGLVTLLTLFQSGLALRLSCMNLLPSIARPKNLGARVPLACTYHNWLGERRVVLPMVHALDWPGFRLPAPGSSGKASVNPYPLLGSLANLDRAAGSQLIAELDRVPAEQWLKHASPDAVREAESFFFLSRSQTTTLNWWLYDHRASQSMSRVLHRLAWVQQVLWQPV